MHLNFNLSDNWKAFQTRWKERQDNYRNMDSAKEWFEKNYDRIRQMFSEKSVREIVFAPILSAIKLPDESEDTNIRTTIATVALANAVMAGLPGRLGVGVYVSMALEAWMALRIAQHIGLADQFKKPSDIFKKEFLGAFGGVILTIGWGFIHLLRFVFSIIVLIPGIPATFVAEIIVTNLIGVLFWVGFEELQQNDKFHVPRHLWNRVRHQTIELVKFQTKALKETCSPEKIKLVGERAKAFLSGDVILPNSAPAELFVTVAMYHLLKHDFSSLKGPLGDIFYQSIRDRWSTDLSSATREEIANHMSLYDESQMIGVLNVIKGKMFERLVEIDENTDGDNWSATLHSDESHPGSDIIFSNLDTGDTIEVSLKAVKNTSIIEHALLKYPDIPILTTSEMEAPLGGLESVSISEISNDELNANAAELFEEMMAANSQVTEHMDTVLGVSAGTGIVGVTKLWPFVAAYMRNKISKDHLEKAFVGILGTEGKELAKRIALGTVFGPIYIWYLLARGVMLLTAKQKNTQGNQLTSIKYLEFKPS
jgi:hypothetical protein